MIARWGRSCVGVAAGAALALAAGPPAGAAQTPQASPPVQSAPAPLPAPSFEGRWELNVQGSERVPGVEAERPDDPGGGRPGVPGGGRGGGRGGGGFGGGRGGREGGREGAPGGERSETFSAREQMSRVMEAPRVLTIVQKGDTITLTTGDGRVTTVKADGLKVKEQQAGAEIERTSRFDGRSLVTETKLSNGVHVTQTFTKVAEGLQLVIVTTVKGGRFGQPVEFKRVYDQALQDHVG